MEPTCPRTLWHTLQHAIWHSSIPFTTTSLSVGAHTLTINYLFYFYFIFIIYAEIFQRGKIMTSLKRILSYCVVIQNREQLFWRGSVPRPMKQIFKKIKPVLSGWNTQTQSQPLPIPPATGGYKLLIPIITLVKATCIYSSAVENKPTTTYLYILLYTNKWTWKV